MTKLSTALVTGGAGFIGSNLVERLLQKKVKVRVLDDLSTGCRENIQNFEDYIDFIEGSICDQNILRYACQKVDTVFHIAAIPSVPRSLQFPEQTTQVNVEGTVKVLEAAVKAKVRRVVFASSSSVYGDTPVLPKHEEMVPHPLSPYAASKLSGEYYCQVFSQIHALETVCLRFFNVYGPRQTRIRNMPRSSLFSSRNSCRTNHRRFMETGPKHATSPLSMTQ